MQRAIIMKENKADNGGKRKWTQNSGRHDNADKNKGEQSERMGHRWEHSTAQLLMPLFSGFSTKYSDKPQIRWLSGKDKWKCSFVSLGFQVKGRYNLHTQKIEYSNIFWQEEKHSTVFKTRSLCLVCIKFYWKKQNKKKENVKVTDRKRDKFWPKKGGENSKLDRFEKNKRQIKNTLPCACLASVGARAACAGQVQGLSCASLSWTRIDPHAKLRLPECTWCLCLLQRRKKETRKNKRRHLNRVGAKRHLSMARGKRFLSRGWAKIHSTSAGAKSHPRRDRGKAQEEVHLREDCGLSSCVRSKEELKQRNHYKINPASCFAIALPQRLIVAYSEEEAGDLQEGSRGKLRHVYLSLSLNISVYF